MGMHQQRLSLLRPCKIPAAGMLSLVTLVAAGEVVDGTSPAFVFLVAVTLLCIGATYNILGGLSTVGGIAFAGFASCTLVISQLAKIILHEAADETLQAPLLTIEVYFVFYLCLMIGCFVVCRFRIPLPKPLEPKSPAQARIQYFLAMTIGIAATLIYEIKEASLDASERSSSAHSLGLIFSTLLLLAIVLAVQDRIRESNGSHSIGLKAAIPWLATIVFGAIETTRTRVVLPFALYAFTCYASGYRFRRKHYALAICSVAVFALLISPFLVYARGPVRRVEFGDRSHEIIDLLRTMPGWVVVKAASSGGSESGSIEDYYRRPGTFLLSRLSVIQADGNMIHACSTGFHYGFAALKIDVLHNLPHFLYKDKPLTDGASLTGRITGMNPDDVENGEFLITVIGDSYGAFGWLGVAAVGLVAAPLVLTVYESMFDMTLPWGIVAVTGFCSVFSEADMGKLLTLMVRGPVVILFLSYFVGALTNLIPIRGDVARTAKGWRSDEDDIGLEFAREDNEFCHESFKPGVSQ